MKNLVLTTRLVSIVVVFLMFFSVAPISKAVVKSNFESAINWAYSQKSNNNREYNGWCLRFVQDAFRNSGMNVPGKSCARIAGDEWCISNSCTPPRGSLVFWNYYGPDAYGNYDWWGHIGISLGNNRVIHAYGNSGIIESNISEVPNYRGYGYINQESNNNQFISEYFDNKYFDGYPSFVQSENQIQNNYGTGGPGNGVGSDNFSIRWQGIFDFNPGEYFFNYRSDDGMRVWIDDNLIINDWNLQGASNKSVKYFVQGTPFNKHKIKCEYFEQGGDAEIRLSWTQVSSSNNITPASDEVIVFDGINYQGSYVRLKVNYYTNPERIGLQNDSISSIKVGSNVQACLYEHDRFDGRSEWFSYDDPDLRDNPIGNDNVSSMKVYNR